MKKLILAPYGLVGLFSRYGEVCSDPQILLKEDKKVDVIVFPGGPDVPPQMYGEEKHPRTYADANRYRQFDDLYTAGHERGTKMVGICGGAQFLCVKAGGRLIQHVEGHAKHGTHQVVGPFGFADVTSSHHQMMHPYGVKDYDLLAWADGISPIHQNGKQEEVLLVDNKEPEAIWFHSTKQRPASLAVQWHPEWMQENHSGFQLFETLLQNYIFN